MVVSSVRRVKSRWVVDISGERFVLTREQYEERPMEAGDEVDVEALDAWLMRLQYRPALEYAVGQLAQRAHAAGELTDKLLRCGYRPCTAEIVVYKLQKLGLMEDADFARQWAQSRARGQVGQRRIAMELRRKGVSEEDTEAALAAIDPAEEQEAAIALAKKALRRARPGEDPRKTVQRTLAALARRGYGYAEAREAIERAIRDG